MKSQLASRIIKTVAIENSRERAKVKIFKGFDIFKNIYNFYNRYVKDSHCHIILGVFTKLHCSKKQTKMGTVLKLKGQD